MDLTFSERETGFRDEPRAWFSANDPGEEPRGGAQMDAALLGSGSAHRIALARRAAAARAGG